jgi:ribosomal protein L40E
MITSSTNRINHYTYPEVAENTKNPVNDGAFSAYSGQISLLHWLYIHVPAVLGTFGFKDYPAINLSKQSMVSTTTHVQSGMKCGATLPHENVTCPHCLATKQLDTQAFGF